MVQLPPTTLSPLRKISLLTGWQVRDFLPDTASPADLSCSALDTTDWLSAPVPGDVNAVLVAAGRMPDPHFGDNARQCYWVSAREWCYRVEFAHTPAAAQCDLCLEGVDGHADLFLNGAPLGRLENAFRPYRFNVTGKLRSDAPNVLLLRFQAIDAVMGGPRTDELGGWGDRRTLMRKAQYSFGWDWALPLPSIGIAGGVWLEEHAGPRLLDVAVQPFMSGRLDWKFAVNTAARDAGYALLLRVHGHGAALEQRIERPDRVKSHVTVQIDNPRLWWPNGMGEQPLYDYEVELLVGGTVVERRGGRLGIRETRILEEPFTEDAGPGIAFWLEINRQRVFCKGGNCIPSELWPATATEEQYRFYLHKTAEAHFNMLRIWGGGIYERDLFYDLCDELGIMVWQDFMFASAGYPLERLRHEIIVEAEHQLTRLRNRPCIVLWCGGNEDVYSWRLPDEQRVNAMTDSGVYSADSGEVDRLRDDPQLYSMILRGTVSRLGLGVPFVESSPMSHEDYGNAPESGNCHISNDGRAPGQVAVTYGQERLHGERVWSNSADVAVGPVETVRFARLPAETMALQPGDYLFIDALLDGHPLPRITYFPRQWKEIAWPEPHCRLALREQHADAGGWRTSLELTTDAYARFLHLNVSEDRGQHWWDDNWFDLCAGASREVTVRSSWPLTLDEITIGHWRTRWGGSAQ